MKKLWGFGVAVAVASVVAQVPSVVWAPGRSEQLHPPVLEVHAGCGSARMGTATVVAGPGGDPVVLTAAHVPASSSVVSTPLGPASVSPLVGFDAARVLIADPPHPAPSGRPVGVGQRVRVVGYPSGVYTQRSGAVVSVERRRARQGPAEVLVVSAPVSGGFSGGAVIDDAGAVIGLVVAADPATGYAVAYQLPDVLAAPAARPERCAELDAVDAGG